jgi:hypothetical protein
MGAFSQKDPITRGEILLQCMSIVHHNDGHLDKIAAPTDTAAKIQTAALSIRFRIRMSRRRFFSCQARQTFSSSDLTSSQWPAVSEFNDVITSFIWYFSYVLPFAANRNRKKWRPHREQR